MTKTITQTFTQLCDELQLEHAWAVTDATAHCFEIDSTRSQDERTVGVTLELFQRQVKDG